MSTVSAPDISDLESMGQPESAHTPTPYNYAVTHVFFPVKLPCDNDSTLENEVSLARAVCAAAHAYGPHIHDASQPQWHRITRILDDLQASVQFEHLDRSYIISRLRGIQTGDFLVLFIRSQNAAAILTRQEDSTLFELFEVSPRSDAVKAAEGALICSYPASSIETPNTVLDNGDFQSELADFLSRPGAVDSDLSPPPTRPQYITALLAGILQCVGRTVNIPRITKRIRDNVGEWPDVYGEPQGDWRRSPLWFLIRITTQMFVDRLSLGHALYKQFMLFFMCTLANDPNNATLSSDHLHLMLSKILRRSMKLRSSAPSWLSEMALGSCECLRGILDNRWKLFSTRTSPFQNPSQDDLSRDVQLSLMNSREYIHNALAGHCHEPFNTPFHPNHHLRGTIDDFLSSNGSFFEEAYDVYPDVTLYDVERSVQQDIDDWFIGITNVEDACLQIEILMDKYMLKASARDRLHKNPEGSSTMLLTAIELFVALDKLTLKEIPMLADYSPEIPVVLLEQLFLRNKTALHRLSRAYQYLSSRQSQSHPGWSVLSDEFTDDSFPVRYYDQSPYLQQLKARIEYDAMEKSSVLDPGQQREAASPACTYDRDRDQHHSPGQRPMTDGTEASRPQLPTSLLHAKAVVFELQCPACLRIWRSATSRILYYSLHSIYGWEATNANIEEEDNLLLYSPGLQPYFSARNDPPLSFQMHFAYFYPTGLQLQNNPTLRYAIQHPMQEFGEISYFISVWVVGDFHHDRKLSASVFAYLWDCTHYTSQTSNDILATQADCPTDLSLDEFVEIGHLRSGGSLQWLNILKGLRTRSLNLHRHDVHYLLTQAVFHVGPLNLKTGEWLWHQELQDSTFCDTILDELDSSFTEARVGPIDGVIMNTISLLLTRILSSSPSEPILERAVVLLRRMRRKTFAWVQELSYNLMRAPMDRERGICLQDMVATCRSTFDVDDTAAYKLLHSAEDVEAILSCALLICTLRPGHTYDPKMFGLQFSLTKDYSRLLLLRDCHLAPATEAILKTSILADASDYGVDLAVGSVYPGHKPSAYRWQQLGHPDICWLTCKSGDGYQQTINLDLLDGTLQLDGQQLGGLPQTIRDSPECQHIFHDQNFFLVPSSLPGMDFTTFTMTSQYKVHFALQGNDLVIQAQCSGTNEIHQLIPSGILDQDLPAALTVGHVHWLNLSTGTIELCPVEHPWEWSLQNWRIDYSSKSGQFHVYRGHETLVNIQSPTWTMISQCFKCLTNTSQYPKDHSQDLLVTVSSINPSSCVPAFLQLSVALLCYGLSFFVNERGELESHDFKNMIYDENQSVGALFGLENLLVLQQKTCWPEKLIHRHVLIPSGHIRGNDSHSIWVEVRNRPSNTLHMKPISYHTYKVDAELGCLVGNGLASVQYLADLHAMTSWHIPDPLTSQTGAQAALCLLQSAGCWSIMKLRLSDDYQPGISQYPQTRFARWRTQLYRHYWLPGYFNPHEGLVDVASEARATQRAAYLFSSNATGLALQQDCKDMVYLIPAVDLELKDVIDTITSAICHWSTNTPIINTILSNWVDMWSDHIPTDADSSTNHSKPLHEVHKILEKGGLMEAHQDFQPLFLLPTAAYCSPSHQTAFLLLLIALAKQSASTIPPIHANLNLLDGYYLTEEILQHHLCKYCLDKGRSGKDLNSAIKQLLVAWPSNTSPIALSIHHPDAWDMTGLTASMQKLFTSCYQNLKLKKYLISVLAEPRLSTSSHTILGPPHTLHNCAPLQITLSQLLLSRPAPDLPSQVTLSCEINEDSRTSSNDTTMLNHLFLSLRADHTLQPQYLAPLHASARCYRETQMTHRIMERSYIETLKEHYACCQTVFLHSIATLQQNLGPSVDPHEQVLAQFGQWPPIMAGTLLQYLASTSSVNLPGKWKKCLISLALLLLELQHVRRLLRFTLDGLEEEFLKELENKGCDGWNPEDCPDWLLIQIQGDFLIRHAQAEAAMELMAPQSGENAVMQVNMGEGKSSVILPIAAAALANGSQLVRVIVPKALTIQMFELLVARLGGLANRPIYHLPFSRTLEYDADKVLSLQINGLHQLMSQCMAEHGILLVQPEHVVSLRLMSAEEQICKGRNTQPPALHNLIDKCVAMVVSLKPLSRGSVVGNMFQLLGQLPNQKSRQDMTQGNHPSQDKGMDNTSKWPESLQKWIDSHARDILDESDEILHSRFQLIYTIGTRQQVDGYPARWTITQQILGLVKRHAAVSGGYEHGPPGSFLYVNAFRTSDACQELISSTVEDVMTGQLPNFDFRHTPAALRRAIRSFITDEDIYQLPDTVKRVEDYVKCSPQDYLWTGLLILRGLVASNVLLFALAERRWRIDYGLVPLAWSSDLSRYEYLNPYSHKSTSTTLAVPYQAKDIPAPNTQFGHPDITIILTCLSYYYTGLSEEQLRVSFEILFSQDDPSTEYALWVKEFQPGETVPDSLRTLGTEINLRASEQWDNEIFPLFAWNKATIDFYLSQVVFPKEMKEYPWKISGSSWDLAERREKLITGFSGTNDSQWLLPTSIAQRELDHQQGTNARVLANVLQPENDAYAVTHENGERWSTIRFLKTLLEQQPAIRVLLDVGAQILDHSNAEVARAWLDIAQDMAGAIYFNDNDELTVLTNTGITQSMLSSPLSQHLDRCVTYLDHAHTRGTDINFPVGSRAAVTLGPRVTKDRLVQGCMRMRKLGRGHSVMFFAPLEVDQSIRAVVGKKDPNTRVTTVDILHWAIRETWADIQRWAPHWAQQGMNHKSRSSAWARFCNNEIGPEQLSDAWIQPERKSLMDLYAPDKSESAARTLSALDPEIQQHCKDLGILSLPTAQLEEEQEREVNREREREREAELPPKAKPAEHFLHPDVVAFVNTGKIPRLHAHSAFQPVFTSLKKSSAATRDADVWSPFILATVDFCKTTKPDSAVGTIDQYLRPVQWILSRRNSKDRDQLLVVLSPFEAASLLPAIRMSEHVHLHLYAPRMSQRMRSADDLRLYSIPALPSDWSPPWALIDQLNVFAGQLYLRDYQSYLRVCQFLGVHTKDLPDDTAVRWNLLNIPGSFERDEIRFSDSPVPFVWALLAIRTRGRPFTNTHMGRILRGQQLTEKDFEPPKSVASGTIPHHL